jgi:hypothetical protein
LDGINQGTQIEATSISTPTKGKLGAVETLLTKAFTDQTRDIGWIPFLQGKISQYWKAAYMASLPNMPSKDQTTALWGKKLILAIWAFGRSIWEYRNKEIHGSTLLESRYKQSEKLKKEVLYFTTKFHENPFLILQWDKFLFNAPEEKLMASNYDMQSAWLRSVKEAIQVRKQHDEASTSAQQERFHNFVIRRGHPSSQPNSHCPESHLKTYRQPRQSMPRSILPPQVPLSAAIQCAKHSPLPHQV